MFIVTALLCVLQRHTFYRRFWWTIAVFLLTLGIIRSTSLLRHVTDFGRNLAHIEGWYESRRPLQLAVIVGIVLGCSAFATRVLKQSHHHIPEMVACFATVSLLALTAIRSISLHQVDHLLALQVWKLQLGGLLDIMSLLCIAGAAYWKPDSAVQTNITSRK